MDPLSITASVIALIGAVSASVKLVQQLSNAPEDMALLLAEMDALRLLLKEIEPLLTGGQTAPLQGHSLRDVILKAKETLAKIDEILRTKFLRRKSTGATQKPRQIRLGTSVRQLRDLRYNLMFTKLDLMAMLGVLTVYVRSPTHSFVGSPV